MKDNKNMHIAAITWWDDLVPESYKVAIPAYGLTISKTEKIDDATTEVTIEASSSSQLKEFLDDHEEGDYRELDVLSEKCKSDDEYIKAVNAKIKQNA